MISEHITTSLKPIQFLHQTQLRLQQYTRNELFATNNEGMVTKCEWPRSGNQKLWNRSTITIYESQVHKCTLPLKDRLQLKHLVQMISGSYVLKTFAGACMKDFLTNQTIQNHLIILAIIGTGLICHIQIFYQKHNLKAIMQLLWCRCPKVCQLGKSFYDLNEE